MSEQKPLLSVVIPAYNEENRIGSTLEAIDAYLKSQDYAAEVLVVIDGATDGTADVVNSYKEKILNLRVIDNKENHGKGYVVRQGMVEARGELRLFTDADNATPIEEVEKLLNFVKHPLATDDGEHVYDIVIGSIALKESNVEKSESGIRVLAGKMANLLIQVTVLWGIHDTQRGFKLFTAAAADDIFSRLTIDRWGFDIEALAVGRKLKYRIKEVPIHWIHDEMSHVKGSAYVETLLDLVRIRMGLWSGRYKKP